MGMVYALASSIKGDHNPLKANFKGEQALIFLTVDHIGEHNL